MINVFNSLFELAVALNFAYVASESIREIFSRGFLSGARNLSVKFDLRIKEIRAKLATINDSFFPPTKKENIISKLENICNDLKQVDRSLDKKIDSAQAIITNKLKGIYILAAFYSIYLLLLSGIEQIYKILTLNEIFTLNLLTSTFLILIICLSFTNRQLSISYTIVISLILMTVSVIYPITSPFNSDEFYNFLVISSLIISFSPFILITTRISLTSLYYEILASFFYIISIGKIFFVNRDLAKINDLENVFKKY